MGSTLSLRAGLELLPTLRFGGVILQQQQSRLTVNPTEPSSKVLPPKGCTVERLRPDKSGAAVKHLGSALCFSPLLPVIRGRTMQYPSDSRLCAMRQEAHSLEKQWA